MASTGLGTGAYIHILQSHRDELMRHGSHLFDRLPRSPPSLRLVEVGSRDALDSVDLVAELGQDGLRKVSVE